MHIFISAGEASGDLHGSHLARAILAMAPQTRLSCIGGPLLREAGAQVVVDNRDIAVVGGFEVLSHARAIYRCWCKVRSHLAADPPDLVVLIDFPDFNFLLARFARRKGSRLFYYISPQVWAWREYRVKTMKRLLDAMAVILPFEKTFYESRGLKAFYVGHPLVDILASAPGAAEAEKKYKTGIEGPLVGILPGSRRSEIKLLFDILMASARIVWERLPQARFILPVAPSLDPQEISALAAKWGLPLRVVAGDTYGVIRACDLLVTASGTVALEAAILGTPMIITNRILRLSGEIAKRLIRVRFIGLPNLIAGKEVVPEFVQERARPDLIAAEAVSLLEDPERLAAQRRELEKIRECLGEPGISERVARLVLETAGRGR